MLPWPIIFLYPLEIVFFSIFLCFCMFVLFKLANVHPTEMSAGKYLILNLKISLLFSIFQMNDGFYSKHWIEFNSIIYWLWMWMMINENCLKVLHSQFETVKCMHWCASDIWMPKQTEILFVLLQCGLKWQTVFILSN